MHSIGAVLLVSALRLNATTSFVNNVPVKSFPAVSSPPCSAFGMTSTDAEVAQTPSFLMDDILKGNSTAASSAVSMLMDVRGTEKMEEYLGEMLPQEKSKLPLWAKLPLAKYSRRARQLRLSKLLDLSTPSASSDENDDEKSKMRRARNSLLILLRNMANPDSEFKGISSMLAVAKKDAKVGNVSSEDMLKRTPDLETPKYEVLASKKGFEIRQYEKFSVCSVTMSELKTTGSDEESVKIIHATIIWCNIVRCIGRIFVWEK